MTFWMKSVTDHSLLPIRYLCHRHFISSLFIAFATVSLIYHLLLISSLHTTFVLLTMDRQEDGNSNRISDNSSENENNESFSLTDSDDEWDQLFDQSMEHNEQLSAGSEWRRYNFNRRKRKVLDSTSRRSTWLSSLDSMTESKLRNTTCCKTLRCFNSVEFSYFMDRSRYILSASPNTRKTILLSFLPRRKVNFFFVLLLPNGK